MVTNTEVWDKRGEVDVTRCKEVHLLETRDGFRLHHRVLVVLHHGAADQTRQTRRRYCVCVTCRQHTTRKIMSEHVITDTTKVEEK